jgi:hypothetical protein
MQYQDEERGPNFMGGLLLGVLLGVGLALLSTPLRPRPRPRRIRNTAESIRAVASEGVGRVRKQASRIG